MDKSLLRQVGGADGEPRFVMLETIREYALEQLGQREEAEALREQHLAYYLALAEVAAPHLRSVEQLVWADRLEVEHYNFLSALAWAHERRTGEDATTGGAEAVVRLAGALFWFWSLRDYLSEGHRWLEGALAHTNGSGRTAARALTLYALAQTQYDLVAKRSELEESAAIWREIGDKRGLALSLSCFWSLGFITLYQAMVQQRVRSLRKGW